MKKMSKMSKVLAVLLVCMVIVSPLSIVASAAGAYYEAFEKAPVYSEPYKASTKKYTLSAGSVVKVVDAVLNSHGNIWYKLADGNYSFSEHFKTHTHVAKSWGLPSTTYVKSDDTYHLKTYVPKAGTCYCGALMIDGTTTKTYEEHILDANYNCTKCSYVHTHKAVMCIRSSTTYEQKDASNHVKVHYTGDNACSCKKVMSKGDTFRTNEAHTFDANNKCTKCSYVKHVHAFAKKGVQSLTYMSIDETKHTKVDYPGDDLCSCGYVIKKATPIKTYENHTFDTNYQCTKCKHVHKHTAFSCGVGNTKYEQKDASNHIKVVISGDTTCSCGAVVSKGTTSKVSEWHTFGDNNKCTYCGYQKHVHKVDKTGVNSISYMMIDDNQHSKVDYPGAQICSCGYIISKGSPTKTYENHSYDSNGKCSKCKHIKSHTHTTVKCSIGNTTYEQKDTSNHIKVYYHGDNLCSCGLVISKGETSRTNEPHSFDSNNQCTKCGYLNKATGSTTTQPTNNSNSVKPSTPKPSSGNATKPSTTEHKHKGVMCAEPKEKYAPYDATNHLKSVYSGEELCSCGYVVVDGSTELFLEPHTYNSSYICKQCGYNNNIIIDEHGIAPTTYVTIKDDVPVRSYCRKTASVENTLKKKGSEVTITKLVTNQYGHVWGVTTDGYYIYLENLTVYSDSDNTLSPSPCKGTQFGKGKILTSKITSENDPEFHYLVTTYEKVCTTCMQVVRVNDSHTLHTTVYHIDKVKVAHSFDENNTCIQCGHNHAEYLEKEAKLDQVSIALAGAGMVPIVGNIADALDFALSCYRGDGTGMVLSAAAMLPIFGVSAGAAKTIDNISDTANVIDKAQDYYKITVKTENLAEVGASIHAINNFENYTKVAKAINSGSDPVKLIRNADNTDEILSVIKISKSPTAAAELGSKSAREVLLEAADDKSLKNTINDLYRDNAKVLDGGTADAARHEILTGEAVGGKPHPKKVTERINNLNNILKRSDISDSDRLIAEALRQDLLDAQAELVKAGKAVQ